MDNDIEDEDNFLFFLKYVKLKDKIYWEMCDMEKGYQVEQEQEQEEEQNNEEEKGGEDEQEEEGALWWGWEII